MTRASPSPTYTLTLASAPGWSAPVTVRLRKALKVLLRSFGLRVLSIVEDSATARPLSRWSEPTMRPSTPPAGSGR